MTSKEALEFLKEECRTIKQGKGNECADIILKDLNRLEELEKAIKKHLSKLEAFNSRVLHLRTRDIYDCLEDLIDRLKEVLENE